MKRSIWLLVLVSVLVAGAVWLVRNEPRVAAYVPDKVQAWIGGSRDAPKAQPTRTASGQASGSRAPSPVETAPVETSRVTDEVEALGTLAGNESVVIAPEIAGRVEKLGFKEGEAVKEGQPLIVLDSEILKAELQQAQAEFDLAKDRFERNRQLAQRGAGTQVALEQASSELATSQAKVASAKARLEKATINAPFDGVVGLRSVGVGDYVPAGENLITLTDIDPIKVDFRLPELQLGKVKDGQAIEVRIDAIPDRTFSGKIYAIDPVVDVNGRALRLRAQIPNPDRILKPGLFARVKVITDVRENALVVPEAAVFPEGEGKAVYVVDDGKARLNKVVTGRRLPGRVEIVKGLNKDMRVVTAGQMRLKDGAAVEVTPRQAELVR